MRSAACRAAGALCGPPSLAWAFFHPFFYLVASSQQRERQHACSWTACALGGPAPGARRRTQLWTCAAGQDTGDATRDTGCGPSDLEKTARTHPLTRPAAQLRPQASANGATATQQLGLLMGRGEDGAWDDALVGNPVVRLRATLRCCTARAAARCPRAQPAARRCPAAANGAFRSVALTP